MGDGHVQCHRIFTDLCPQLLGLCNLACVCGLLERRAAARGVRAGVRVDAGKEKGLCGRILLPAIGTKGEKKEVGLGTTGRQAVCVFISLDSKARPLIFFLE